MKKIHVVFTGIEGIGYPNLKAFERYNKGVPYSLLTKPADVKFQSHMDRTIRDWWKREGHRITADFIIHSDYDTRIADDIRKTFIHVPDFTGMLTNQFRFGGAGATMNLIVFSRCALEAISDPQFDSVFDDDSGYCETRIKSVLEQAGFQVCLMPSEICQSMLHENQTVDPWRRGFSHPTKICIDSFDHAFHLAGSNTDKNSVHGYGPFYEEVLENYRGKSPRVLVLGFSDVNELRGWKKFLGDGASICGVQPYPFVTENLADGIFVSAADYMSVEFSNSLGASDFDIIIDDGVHSVTNQLCAYENLRGKLRNNGVYIIEDIPDVCAFETSFQAYRFEIVDLRGKKNRYDDVCAIIKQGSSPAPVQSAFKPKSEVLHGFFDYQDLYMSIVDQAPEGAVIVELGVWCGKSLGFLAEYAQYKGKHLRIFGYDYFDESIFNWHQDTLHTGLAGKVKSSDDWASAVRRQLIESCPENPPEIVRSETVKAADMHEDSSVWALFVDANHSEESVCADLQAWIPKLIPGGILAGHDFSFPSVKAGIARAGIMAVATSRDSWITRQWPVAKSSTPRAEDILHILITCSRPDGLARIVEQVKHFDNVRLHVGFDFYRRTRSGEILKNRMLPELRSGWIWFCDDDNVPGVPFLQAMAEILPRTPAAVLGYIVSQTRNGNLFLAKPPRVNETDIAQIVARCSAIGDTRLPHYGTGDGYFVRAMWDKGGIELLPDVIVPYNEQSLK